MPGQKETWGGGKSSGFCQGPRGGAHGCVIKVCGDWLVLVRKGQGQRGGDGRCEDISAHKKGAPDSA